jgi:hypothetical protein
MKKKIETKSSSSQQPSRHVNTTASKPGRAPASALLSSRKKDAYVFVSVPNMETNSAPRHRHTDPDDGDARAKGRAGPFCWAHAPHKKKCASESSCGGGANSRFMAPRPHAGGSARTPPPHRAAALTCQAGTHKRRATERRRLEGKHDVEPLSHLSPPFRSVDVDSFGAGVAIVVGKIQNNAPPPSPRPIQSSRLAIWGAARACFS